MNWTDPTHRAVHEDFELERGRVPDFSKFIRLASAMDVDADVVVAVTAVDVDGDVDAVAVTDVDGDVDAVAVTDVDAVADVDVDAVVVTNAGAVANLNLYRGETMKEGLVLLQLPGRYWAVTRVGWARRVEGDEWELFGAVTVTRIGASVPLDELASNGPGNGHTCSPQAKLPELLHRWSPRRVLVANESAWAEHCPKPLGWKGNQ